MRPLNKKTTMLFTPVVILLTLTAFAGFRWYENEVDALPYLGRAGAFESRSGVHFAVPAFSFVNQNGGLLDDSFVRGKVWVVNYFYMACPSICPKMMAGLEVVQEAFRGDGQVRLISLTVNPELDTPKALKNYASARHADLRQWQFGTGSKKSLYLFARKGLGITASEGDGGPEDFIHSDRLVLVDRRSHIRGFYDGTDRAEVAQLVKDIRKLEKN